MADLTITPANVVPAAGVPTKSAIAGDTITAGDTVYIDSSDSHSIKPCDADAEASAVCVGIALNGASDGQPVTYQTGGLLTIGATVVVGVAYYVTPTTGGLGAWAEVQADDYATLVCIGTTTAIVNIRMIVTGAVKV
jgi:hypothetical protein